MKLFTKILKMDNTSLNSKSFKPSGRVVIIGAGLVGSTTAYSLLSKEYINEVLLLDINQELETSQVMDLEDSTILFNSTIKTSSYSDIKNNDIVVITAGCNQKDGESRLDLKKKNEGIVLDICSNLNKIKKDIIVLMVTNPVDYLTHIAINSLKLPRGRVFGSGTYLDSLRLRLAISQDLKVSVNDVEAIVLGEHGDSSVPIFTKVLIKAKPLSSYYTNNLDKKLEEFTNIVRDKAYNIIKGKNATYYGISTVISNIIEAIVLNKDSVIPLSYYTTIKGYENDIIGIMCMVNGNGVVNVDYKVSDEELELIVKSLNVIY